MSSDLCLKQLHVVHIKVFHRMQYIRLLWFYSVIFQSCKFQSPVTNREDIDQQNSDIKPTKIIITESLVRVLRELLLFFRFINTFLNNT